MKIPLSKPYFDQSEKTVVNNIMDSGILINGPEVKSFESEFSKYIGSKYAISMSSGTAALFNIFNYLKIKPGDEVICPSHTFIASISPAIYLGAKPVFVDINPHTYTMDPMDVRRKVTSKTKAIICVHLYGHPCDMDPILEIASEEKYISDGPGGSDIIDYRKRYQSIPIIEDCCQSHGAEYKGKKVGNIGDFGVFSFFPSKIMTTGGDGGMITTNNKESVEFLQMFKDQGRKDKYNHKIIGLNLRMSEIPAGIGRIQLAKLDEMIRKRMKIVYEYNEAFILNPVIIIPKQSNNVKISPYVYTIRLDNRDKFVEFMTKNDIGTGIYYPIPIHKQLSIHNNTQLPITESIVDRIVSLPLYPDLLPEQQDIIISYINQFHKIS